MPSKLQCAYNHQLLSCKHKKMVRLAREASQEPLSPYKQVQAVQRIEARLMLELRMLVQTHSSFKSSLNY